MVVIDKYEKIEILTQTDLTNTVWDANSDLTLNEYCSDEGIKERLSDFRRGIKFKRFLMKNEKYNIVERRAEKSHPTSRSLVNIVFSRTSGVRPCISDNKKRKACIFFVWMV
ncbi:TPA: hypothetical protein ACOZVG_001823 [Yersinia enterocolitica]